MKIFGDSGSSSQKTQHNTATYSNNLARKHFSCTCGCFRLCWHNQSIPEPSLTGSLTLEVERKPFPTRKSLSKTQIFYTKKQPQNTFGVAIFSKFWQFFFQFLLPRRGLLASTPHSQPRVVPRSSSLRGCHEEADLGNHR